MYNLVIPPCKYVGWICQLTSTASRHNIKTRYSQNWKSGHIMLLCPEATDLIIIFFFNFLIPVVKKYCWTGATNIRHLPVILSWRGIWCKASASDFLTVGTITRRDLAVIATRVLIGGIIAHRDFNRSTAVTFGRWHRPKKTTIPFPRCCLPYSRTIYFVLYM